MEAYAFLLCGLDKSLLLMSGCRACGQVKRYSYSMECLFCHTELGKDDACCPCCGMRKDYMERQEQFDKFMESVIKKDYEKKKRELRKLKRDTFEMKFYYCIKDVALGCMGELRQLSAVDYDYLIVLVRYHWHNYGYTNIGYGVVGFYDKNNEKVRRVRLTDKLYIEGSDEGIGRTGSSWFNDDAFRLYSVTTFEQVGRPKGFPVWSPWDLTKLDEKMGVQD